MILGSLSEISPVAVEFSFPMSSRFSIHDIQEIEALEKSSASVQVPHMDFQFHDINTATDS
jgi:hypothetical protein